MDLSLDNDTDCDSIAPLGFGREISGSGVALRGPANADVGFAASVLESADCSTARFFEGASRF